MLACSAAAAALAGMAMATDGKWEPTVGGGKNPDLLGGGILRWDPDPVIVDPPATCNTASPFDYYAGVSPTTTNPVDLATGNKLEYATDLMIPMAGMPFVLSREYTSWTGAWDGYGLGANWSLSTSLHLKHEREDTTDRIAIGGMAKATKGTYWLSNSFSAGSENRLAGATAQTVKKANPEIDRTHMADGEWPVWRLTEPGQWQIDFIRPRNVGWSDPTGGTSGHPTVPAGLEGNILTRRDPYGNRHEYDYAEVPLAGSNTIWALKEVKCFTSANQLQARIEFEYEDDTTGRLLHVSVHRPFLGDGPDDLETHHVYYTYHDGDGEAWLGSSWDMIQVAVWERVDPEPDAAEPTDPVWRKRYTQYRYHVDVAEGPVETVDTDSDGDGYFNEYGDMHQLKMVINPEQIEYYAQLKADDEGGLHEVGEYTDDLMALGDGTADGDVGFKPVNLAAKLIPNYRDTTGEVTAQVLLTGCGCNTTSTQGLRQDFTYSMHDDPEYSGGRTVVILESYWDEGEEDWIAYRRRFADLYQPAAASADEMDNQGWYMLNDVTADLGSNYWVKHFQYATDGSNTLLRVCMPSATNSYTPYAPPNDPADAIAPTYEAKSADGLVYAYDYDSLARRTETRLHKGWPSGDDLEPADIELYWLLEARTYRDTSGEEHLVERIDRIRTEGETDLGGVAADDMETTLFDYGLYTLGPAVKAVTWVKTSVEAELPTENGPAGEDVMYSSWEVYDLRGLNIWSVAADGSYTKRVFDNDTAYPASVSRTGQVVKVIRNADLETDEWQIGEELEVWMPSSGLPDDRNAENPEDSGEDDGTLSLTTTITRDLLGRVQATTSPGGVVHATAREMRTSIDRDGIAYYAEITLPFEYDEDDFDGAATVTWFDAANRPFASQGFLLTDSHVAGDQEEQYRRVYDDYSLAEGPVSRTYSHQSVSGVVEYVRQWHRFTWGGAYYESTVEHDPLGRVHISTNGVGTKHKFTYDIRDRVKTVSVAVDGQDWTEVEARYYDSSTTTESEGDGNLTYVVSRIDGSSGDRATTHSYDYRNRRISTSNPLPPHQVVAYDNLGRAIETAAIGAAMSSDAYDLTDDYANRASYSRTAYSQRGLAYRSEQAILPAEDSGTRTYLARDSWFDEVGRAVGTRSPSSAGSKTTFDGLGRVAASYTTDNVGFADFEEVFDDAGHDAFLSEDRVLEQVETQFVTGAHASKGLPELVTHRFRRHDDASNKDTLSGLVSVDSFSGYLYDDAGRISQSVEYGTGQTTFSTGGSAPTITQGTPETPSATVLVTASAYDARGLLESSTDSGGSVTKFLYDGLGRRFATIENYVNATVAWPEVGDRWIADGVASNAPDEDRVTSTVYDAAGHTVMYIAHQEEDSDPGDRDQVTTYTYGVEEGSDPGDSALWSNDLLASVEYPDEGVVGYAYNRQGELTYMVDQNESVHEYTRDKLGRVTLDDATPGTGVYGADDGEDISAILSIAREYYPNGLLKRVTSNGYNTVGEYPGIGVLNEVWFGYTPLLQVEKVWQNSTGAVATSGDPAAPVEPPTGTTRLVKYTYTSSPTGSLNTSRLASMDYPRNVNSGGSVTASLDYEYGSGGGINDLVSRVDYMDIDNTRLVYYRYVGVGIFAEVDYAEIDVQLDRTISSNGYRRNEGINTQSAGVYPGLDRFGRVIRQDWVDGDFTSHDHLSIPERPQVVSLGYTYDVAGNRSSMVDLRPGSLWKHSFEYGYDGLDRLGQADRGKWDGDSLESQAGSQQWTLDLLGNWTQWKKDSDYSGSFGSPETDNREHNWRNNELDQSDFVSGTDEDFTYDDAGNMATRTSGTAVTTYSHDSWNRLVKVDLQVGSDPVEHKVLQQFNGLNWRTVKYADTAPQSWDGDEWIQGAADGDLDETHVYSYDASWRLLDERIFAEEADVDDRFVQYVWGTRYIDDCILHRVDRVSSGDFDGDFTDAREGEYHHITDAMFSTVALMKGKLVVERVTYDPYGRPLCHSGADLNGDGTVTDSGSTLAENDEKYITSTSSPAAFESWIGDADWTPQGDIDRSSEIWTDDLTAFETIRAAAPEKPAGHLSGFDNGVGFDGYLYDAEDAMYTVRNRSLEPSLGRWTERDPLGYVDSLNPFQYGLSAPPLWADARGTEPNLTECEQIFNDCRENAKRAGDLIILLRCQRAREACIAVALFLEWYEKEKRAMAWANLLPWCPCNITLPVAPGVPVSPSPPVWDDPKRADGFHPGAAWCMRSKAVPSGHGQQCCYDAKGQLITSGPGAGTSDKVSPDDPLGHWNEDVVPFGLAEKGDRFYNCGDKYRRKYWEVRPINGGRDPLGNPCPSNPS